MFLRRFQHVSEPFLSYFWNLLKMFMKFFQILRRSFLRLLDLSVISNFNGPLNAKSSKNKKKQQHSVSNSSSRFFYILSTRSAHPHPRVKKTSRAITTSRGRADRSLEPPRGALEFPHSQAVYTSVYAATTRRRQSGGGGRGAMLAMSELRGCSGISGPPQPRAAGVAAR